jgi:nicotinamide mononucleotide transporter
MPEGKYPDYPTGIINVLTYVYLCFTAGLYADMGINAFYFVMSVYGWYRWAHKDKEEHHLPISVLSGKEWILYTVVTAAFLLHSPFHLVRFTDSTVPEFDSFTTAIFITGMWSWRSKRWRTGYSGSSAISW